jgi:hypothetical protein
MGLIRKSLYLGTGGLVASNSKKQRKQKQILAAMEGATPSEIKRAGGRYDFNGFWGQPSPSVVRRAAVQGSEKQAPVSMAQALAYQAAESNSERAPITGTVSGAKPAFGGNTEFTLIGEGGEEELWEARNNRLPRGPDIKVMGRFQPGLRLMGSALNGKAVRVYPSRKPGKASWVDLAEQEPESKTAGAAAPSTAEGRLAEVTRLHSAGVLTDEEYQAKRAEIIDEL